MRHTIMVVLLAAAVVVAASLKVHSQQPSAQSATGLRKQIDELLVIDRDASTPEEVKILNQKFIQERRSQLRELLKARIQALQKYQLAVKAIISSDEQDQVGSAIRDLEKELEGLEVALANSGAITAPTISATPREEASSAISNDVRDKSVPVMATVGNGASAPADTASAQIVALSNPQPSTGGKAEQELRDQLAVHRGNIVDTVVQRVKGKTGANRATAATAFGPLRSPTAFALALSLKALPQSEFTREIESARVDKQVGGSALNAGSTSLVSKGSIPGILGFAVENGGLTQTTDGTTITFRGNPVGLFDALAGKGFFDSFEDDSLTVKRLRKLSFALSYDTSLSNTPNLFIGNRSQLSSYSFRYEFFNHRDPRDPTYANAWKRLITENAQAVATTANIVQDLFFRDAGLKNWLDTARAAIANADDSQLETVANAQFESLERVELSPAVEEAVANFSQAFSEYKRKRSALLNMVDNGPIFAVEYTNKRRPGLIDTSNLNFIYATGIAEGKASFTFNGAATIFNARPAVGMNRIRDFDFAAQLDIPLGDPRGFGQFDLSFAGRYRRLVDDEIANGVLLNAKGDIGTFNLKLDVPIRDLGMKFPLSFTYSNRTDFNLKRQLQANFGFAFDPDFLYNLLKPFSKK